MSKTYTSIGTGIRAKAVQYTGDNFEECVRFSGGLLYREAGEPVLWGHEAGDVSHGDWLIAFGKDDLAKVSDEKFRTLFPEEIQ